MAVTALLYSADAPDQTLELSSVAVDSLSERQLLWIDLGSPTDADKQKVASLLACKPELLQFEVSTESRPSLVNYGSCFRITARAVSLQNGGERFNHDALTLVVGPGYVVSVHAEGTDFLEGLRTREKGDSAIGMLSSESFAASLLDWLLNTYFQALDALVREVDRVEVAILGKKIPAQHLESLVKARRRVAELRRALKSHRDVFYGLARPDFTATELPEAKPHFEALNKHYERAEDELETARDLVIGSFELLSTRAVQKTSETMRALTFVTVLMGTLAFLAGIMGMNFELAFFKTGTTGFLIVSGSMVALSALAVWIAFRRSWI